MWPQGAGKGKRIHGKGEEGAADDGAAGPSGRAPVARAHVRLPLEVGTLVDCRWRDDTYYPARIIERRQLSDARNEEDWDYYVHYRKCECRSCVGSA